MPSTTALRHVFTSLAVLLLSAHLPAAADDDIVTDRPDFVESSKVVGPGRFQIETSVAAERARADGARSRTVTTPTLLRYGVGEAFELRLETDGRINENTTLPGSAASHTTGYADTSLGVKWHLMDDAPGLPSVGVLLHADLASGSRTFRGDGVRPSLRLAAEWELPAGMSLGVMPGIGIERNDTGGRYHYGIFGLVLGKELAPAVRGFVEVAAPRIARAGDGGTVATFDAGSAWLLSERCQLDAMLSFGLNRRTPDLAFTAGFSFKL